jgi:hypothetical protein
MRRQRPGPGEGARIVGRGAGPQADLLAILAGDDAVPLKRTERDLLDHLVGAGEQRVRHRDPERPRGLQVDHQFEFRRGLDRQLPRIGSAQNSVDVGCRPPEQMRTVDPVGHEATALGEGFERINCRQAIARGQFDDRLAVGRGQRGREYDERAIRLPCGRGNRTLDIRRRANSRLCHPKAEQRPRTLDRLPTCAISGNIGVHENCDICRAGRDLFKQFEPFAPHLSAERNEPGHVSARVCQARGITSTDRI